MIFTVNKRITKCRAAFLLTIGFVTGILLNQYGLLLENIRVDVIITVAEENNTFHVATQSKDSTLLETAKTTFVVPNIVHFIWQVATMFSCLFSFIRLNGRILQ